MGRLSLNPVEAGSEMKAALVLVSFILLACVLAQGYEENQKEVHGRAQETMEAIPGAFNRIKRKAESIKKKNRERTKTKSKKKKKNLKKEIEKKKVRNGKKKQKKYGKRKIKRKAALVLVSFILLACV